MSQAVITFGRMNPPTIGHQKLVDKINHLASIMKDADPMVYLSHSQDYESNPLDYDTKVILAANAFSDIVSASQARTIIDVMKELDGHYDDIVYVCGSDRVLGFDALLNKYNSVEYSFKSITVVSAGSRDPDSDSVEGISASKMREYAAANDAWSFEDGLPEPLRPYSNQVLNLVRKGMLL